MSLSEAFQDLDPKIAAALSRAVAELRAEFRSLLEGGAPAPGSAPEEAPDEETFAAESIVSAPPAPSGAALLDELKHAVAGIDRASTQSEVLTALLEGARRFASRAALLLVRPGTLEGWNASGFDGLARGFQDLEIDLRDLAGAPWPRAVKGAGTVPLDASDCARLCDALGAEPPAVGLLLPLVLGDRVAAVLYGDRLPGDGSLEVTALQLLTYNAGQILETLPVRGRSGTATLRIAGSEPAETTAEEPPPAEPEPAAAAEAQPAAELSVEPEPEPEPEPKAAPEEADREEQSTRVVETETVTVTPPALEELPDEISLEPEAAGDAPLLEEPAEPDLAGRPGTEPSETSEIPHLPEAAPDRKEPAAALEPEPRPEPSRPTPAADEDLERSSTLVQPPSDLSGPGWAFTQEAPAGELGNEAQHEEARRLARLLVTEIKLYNEEQVEIGRQQRDLQKRLKDDIARSRQIYSDRIDASIRGDKDYFQEALVRILAAGDAGALGA